MNVLGLLFVVVLQFLTGRGMLALFNIKHKPLLLFVVSNICGVMVFSIVPFLLQMLYLPITAGTVAAALVIVTAILFCPQWTKYDFSVLKRLRFKWPPIYEVFFIMLFVGLMIPSVWRCFFYPPSARDILSGAEAMAEFTVREHTMLNSIFTINLESTNNHLKQPFVLDLQIIYKLFVHEFGNIWLSIVVVSFLVWLYILLRDRLHPVIAAVVLLFFISMPDPYGYTYVILYDYCNGIMLFAGFYYLSQYAESKQVNYFFFAVLMFGFATFIRGETLLFIAMTCPLLLYLFRINQVGYAKQLGMMGAFLLVPFVFYYVWMGVFVKHYMPVQFDPGQQVVLSADRVGVFFERLKGINERLLLGGKGIGLYGYMIYFFLLVLVADLIFVRTASKEARIAIYAATVIYFGLPLLGALIPWVDFNNTTKRGIFKLFPLILLYLRNSPVLVRISSAINSFEFPVREAEVVSVAKHVHAGRKKKKR